MQDNTRVDAAGGNLLAGAGHAPWGGLPGPGPAIEFVPHEAGKYLEVFRALLAQGTRQFTVQGWSPEVRAFLALAGELEAQHTFELQAFGEDLKQACIEGLPVRAAMPDAGAVFLFMPSGPALSTALMQYAEAQHVVLCADHGALFRPPPPADPKRSEMRHAFAVRSRQGDGLRPTAVARPPRFRR